MVKMLIGILVLAAFGGLTSPGPGPATAIFYKDDTTTIRKTSDFTITGKGDNSAWNSTSWLDLTRLQPNGLRYATKSKMLYSEKGIYLLFSGEDSLITTKDYKDDEEIYEGDVFEFFLRTDTTKPPYFEYEINPREKQLTLTLARYPHANVAWSPWAKEYKEDPLIKRKVFTTPHSWSAEIFFPYALLALLPDMPPKSGTIWHANFCRIDYDRGNMTEWSWSKKIIKSFHELEHFGTIIFE